MAEKRTEAASAKVFEGLARLGEGGAFDVGGAEGAELGGGGAEEVGEGDGGGKQEGAV